MRECSRCHKEMSTDGVTNTEGCKHFCTECVREMFGCSWQESVKMKAEQLRVLATLNDRYGDYSKMVK